MRLNTNVAAMKHITLFLLFLFLSTCLNNALEGAEKAELVGEMMKGVKDVIGHYQKRKKVLEASVREPLTEVQQQLLHQLLQRTGTLDETLSSAPYLTYLKAEVGQAYKDFPTYVAAMPTAERKTEVLFSFKKVLPPKTTVEALSICADYYFKLRLLSVKEPDILDDKNALVEFQAEHLMEPLMAISAPTELLSHMSGLMQMGMVTNLKAQIYTEVFHDVWREWLEEHSSSEGLLRCAIATPTEFALMRSFFEDTAAFEKWIQIPLKTENGSKERKKK